MMGRTLQRLTPSRPLRLALLAFVAMLVLAAAILTNEGAQAQIMKPVGASGNTQSADKCPGSTFLVGFMVRYGDWLNAIGIICAPVDGAGNTGAQVPQPPSLRGGTGGSQPTPVTCAPNQVAVGVLIHLTSDGRRVRGIDLDCKPATANDLQTQRLGIMFSLGHNDTAAISQLCVPNNAISEVDINWGADVNGVGVTCAMVHQPPPSTATLATGQTQQGPFGGPGGGPFQITCNSGDQVVGFDTMEQNGVLVGIAPVCAHRQTSPTDTYGRPSAGTSTGPWNRPRCEPNAVVTILDVFVGNLPFVSTVGFTCWNTKTNNMTNSFPDAGSPKVSDKRLVCPSGQIAVGIYGRAGTAIDQVGVICDNWAAPTSSSPPPSLPTMPTIPPATSVGTPPPNNQMVPGVVVGQNGCPSAATLPPQGKSDSPSVEGLLMCLINAERTARGLSALAFDAHLQATTLAEGQASVNQKWWGQSSSHVNPQTEAGMSDDQAIDTRFKASGYCDTSKHTYRDGEITYNASGPTGKYSDDETPPKQTNFTCLNACGSPTAAVDWWMNVSPPHRALILTPDFTNVGVTAIGDTAILNDPYTPKGLYIVDFGKCQ